MEVYFSPEWMAENVQILNVVNDKEKPVGYLCILHENKKMYIFGNLQESGLKEDYHDLIRPYVQGLSKSNREVEMFSYITVGGEIIHFDQKQETE